jgi:putative phosphoesterase
MHFQGQLPSSITHAPADALVLESRIMMLGILSDNHGRTEPVAQAAALFKAHGVSAVVHCGDIGDLASLQSLAGRPIWMVWGNTDRPSDSLKPLAVSLGIQLPESVPLQLELSGRRIAVFHGHEPSFHRACASDEFDYIFHGHTHIRSDSRRGRTRIINPGALHRCTCKTVAVLDAQTDNLRFLTIGHSL